MRDALVARNLDWVAKRTKEHNDIFRLRAEKAHAGILWIGCSDNPLADLETAPFDEGVLIHRNLGNQVSHHDASLHATLQSALQVHKVTDIVVCGHYGCRCLRDILTGSFAATGNGWLTPVRTLASRDRICIDRIQNTESQVQLLSEINVRAQLSNLAAHVLIEPSLSASGLGLHGFIWSPRDGLLREIETLPSNARRGSIDGKARRRKPSP